jgi:FKBP-type peptidyl-prolyl cis-trans isomerase SlyD
MNVSSNKVVSIHYTLRDEAGVVLDSSFGHSPLAYLHGQGNLVPGLESALDGKSVGDKLTVSVPPEQGYGVRDAGLVQILPREKFADVGEISPGMQFRAKGPEGIRLMTVTHVERDLVTVDANHPLAGKTLHFQVEITEVRKATREELAHRHVHGPGGHHH